MSSPNLQLHRIDLGVGTPNTLLALVRLLAPHVPYSLQILGTILNTGPRPSTLQDVDLSKFSLWSTISLRPDAIPAPSDSRSALFSLVIFSHLNGQFRFFCSGESHAGPPTEAEETHVKQVFEHLRDMACDARPAYDSAVAALGPSEAPRWHRRHADAGSDPPMIVVGGVHGKWTDVLAPVSASQNPYVRYAFPRRVPAGGLADHCRLVRTPTVVRRDGGCQGLGSGDDSGAGEAEVPSSEICTSDLAFVRSASAVPRSDPYILSRAPYSACVRVQSHPHDSAGAEVPEPESESRGGRHSDGSIGGLHVDPRYQRRGPGTRVVRALADKLDFGEGQDDAESLSDDGDRWLDLGGGALGWNWTDTGVHNEAGSRLFTSLVGEEGIVWTCYWTYIPLEPNQ